MNEPELILAEDAKDEVDYNAFVSGIVAASSLGVNEAKKDSSGKLFKLIGYFLTPNNPIYRSHF